MPIPAPNPDALAADEAAAALRETAPRQLAVLKLPMGMLKGGPDVSAAAHAGTPNLNPPDDTVSAMEVLNARARLDLRSRVRDCGSFG